jgi:hypothetical protein
MTARVRTLAPEATGIFTSNPQDGSKIERNRQSNPGNPAQNDQGRDCNRK